MHYATAQKVRIVQCCYRYMMRFSMSLRFPFCTLKNEMEWRQHIEIWHYDTLHRVP